MGFFRKLLMTLWFLAALFGAAALALTIYGPWTPEALALFMNDTYNYAVQACLAVSGIGAFVMWVRVLARRKRTNAVELEDGEGGTISIARDAIASQAICIVEDDGSCEASKVQVFAEKRGMISVRVVVCPRYTVSVVGKGAELQEALASGLARLCGDRISQISLEFLAPDQPRPLVDEDDAWSASGTREDAPQESPEAADEGVHVHADPSGDGVTISMKGMAAREEESDEETER